MTPLDPAETTKKQNESPMAPPYVDDDPNMELTEQGMRAAENERRDEVTGGYEAAATQSSESDEALDGISFTLEPGELVRPLPRALRRLVSEPRASEPTSAVSMRVLGVDLGSRRIHLVFSWSPSIPTRPSVPC